MNNIISGISTNESLIQSRDLSYENSLIDGSQDESFSQVMYQNLVNSYSYGIRNVPIGRSSTLISNIPNYNSTIDTSTNEIENIYTNFESDTSTNTKFRVEIQTKDVATKNRIAKAVEEASNKYSVDPNLILAVIQTESYFNPKCTSKAGAVGLMQIMPSNFNHLGIKDGYNIEENINGGTKLLREYIDKYNGDIEMALMAYNGGPTRMANRGVKSVNDIYKMPKETQNYVPKVMKIYRGY